MLSQKLVFHKSSNFTSNYEILMPPTVPIHHDIHFPDQLQKGEINALFHYSMLIYLGSTAGLEHSNFFTVMRAPTQRTRNNSMPRTPQASHSRNRGPDLTWAWPSQADRQPQPLSHNHHPIPARVLKPQLRLRAF